MIAKKRIVLLSSFTREMPYYQIILKLNRFRFSSPKLISMSAVTNSRRISDSYVKFRNANESLAWKSVDSIDCDLNAIVHRGIFSENDDEKYRRNSSGKFNGWFLAFSKFMGSCRKTFED